MSLATPGGALAWKAAAATAGGFPKSVAIGGGRAAVGLSDGSLRVFDDTSGGEAWATLTPIVAPMRKGVAAVCAGAGWVAAGSAGGCVTRESGADRETVRTYPPRHKKKT